MQRSPVESGISGDDVEEHKLQKLQQEDHQQQQQQVGQKDQEEDQVSKQLLEVTNFEDLMEVVGTRGRWNFFIFFLCSFAGFASSFTVLSYQFLGATPDHWCHIQPLVEANWTQQQVLSLAIPYSNETGRYSGCQMYDYNYTVAATLGYEASINTSFKVVSRGSSEVVACHERDFNLTQYRSTVVTQWDLVCERRFLYSTVTATSQMGFLLSALVAGYLMDQYGRRPVSLGSLVTIVVLGLIGCFSPNIYVFIALRLVVSMADLGVYCTNFIIMMELCSSSTRSTFSALFAVSWAVGYMVLPGVAYLVRDWQWLNTALFLPYIVKLLDFWLLPESPRWLIIHNRDLEAVEVLTQAAKVNKKTLPPRHALMDAISRIRDQMCHKEESEATMTITMKVLATVKKLFFTLTEKEPRRRMLILVVCWFVASMVYYGLALSATNLSADPYLYLFLGGLLEIPSYLIVWGSLMYLSRRSTLTSLYLLCAVCICINAVVMFAFVNETPVGAKIFLSLCGKIGIAAAFHLLYIYTAELFPTECRSFAVGECSFIGRIGSIASPYINDIMGDVSPWAPSALFAGASTVAAIISLLLSETKGRDLTETHIIKNSDTSLASPTPPSVPHNTKENVFPA